MRAHICIVLLLSIGYTCHAIDRIFRVPLQRKVTPLAGDLGQPVVNYYTPIAIGTPGKVFNIQFDVDFANSFVPHYEWNPFKKNLHYYTGYLGHKSSTSNKSDQILEFVYQKCKLSGKKYRDVIRFIDAEEVGGLGNRLVVEMRQHFIAAGSADKEHFRALPADGFIGLPPTSYSALQIANPLVNMYDNALIDSHIFSIILRRDGGEIIFGGLEPYPSLKSDDWHQLNWIPQDRWTLNLKSVQLGKEAISTKCDQASECQVVISTALNDIYGPRDEVKRLYTILSIIEDGKTLPLIDCRRVDQLPSVTFTIDDFNHDLPARDYVIRLPDGGLFGNETCYVSILPADNYHPRQWILGTNALVNSYLIFDMNKRQIAISNAMRRKSQIPLID